jgi:nanoRNase/pAp phosphatase (c-di-AMP/oligoRNAs hydrolase)
MSHKVRVSIRSGSKVFCISHRDDPDGLASAALVHCATNCRFALAMYEDLDEVLADVPRDVDWLIITDLGLSERREVIRNLSAIARNVLYADHHLLSAESKRLLRGAGVIIRHSLRECTSVLVWDTLRDRLPKGAINLAAYGAKTDPPVSGPLTREVLLRTSRDLAAYEGHLLALALSSEKCTTGLRREIVEKLASLQLPHRMRLVRLLADQQATGMLEIQRRLQDRAQVRGRVAIAQAGELALGMSAELLLGVPNIVASVVYDSTRLPSRTRISARATDDCRRHLGRLMRKIAGRLSGSGGGHRIAAGAVVPTSRLREFLRLFIKKVGD